MIIKEEMAALLNGREIGEEIEEHEVEIAKASGLVVIFGYSDDCMELRGAIDDEVGCNDGKTFKINATGILPDWSSVDHSDEEEAEKYFLAKRLPSWDLDAIWDHDGYSWQYLVNLPHATFEITEDGEKFCRGIVLSIEDLRSAFPSTTTHT